VISNQKLELFEALPKNWGIAASELIRIEESGEWKAFATSFTSYVSGVAARAKKTPSTLWRIISAGREYKALMDRVDPNAKTFPPLERVEGIPAPESLELLGKIERVAPREIIERLQNRALEGKISRNKLRLLWQTYRPLLDGKTKRGRGVSAPKYQVRHDPEGLLDEANMVAMLAQAGPSWLAHHGVKAYKVVKPTGSLKSLRTQQFVPDLIVMVANSEDGDVTTHGVEVISAEASPEYSFLRKLRADRCAFDYFWIATFNPFPEMAAQFFPEAFGILAAGSGHIKVVREAQRISLDKTPREHLLKFLLRNVIRN
jgi:hypothetical protein